MDLLGGGVHVVNNNTTTNRSPFLLNLLGSSNSFPENNNNIIIKPTSISFINFRFRKMRSSSSSFRVLDDFNNKFLEIRRRRRRLLSNQKFVSGSFVVTSMAKKNHHHNSDNSENFKNSDSSSSSSSSSGNGDQSIPEGDGSKGNNPSSESNKSNDSASQKSHHKILDWREFRASLFVREQDESADFDTQGQDATPLESKPLGLKWAHPISSPETGCVLVATEKLDGVRTFERTVVLLLRSGTRHPQEGPFGVVVNRPLHKKIRHMKPTNLDLATTFADCSLHFGGPLEASMFLLKTGKNSQLTGFEEVIPGLCFGARNSLDEAAGLVKKGVLKPQDFRFFYGYAGWQLDQLREEIESDYWYVAACSANLIFGRSTDSSSEGLWEEILQLMGGHYSELSQKPKQDM